MRLARPTSRRPVPPLTSGFSLVELLLAIALSAVLLAAAWGWTWAIAAASDRADDTQELHSALAYVERTLSADVHDASALVTKDSAGCTPSSLTLLTGADGVARVVPIVFDPSRGLLWRLTSSCHLVDGLSDCRFSYLDEAGGCVDCAPALTAAGAARVRRVSLHVVLKRGAATLTATWSAVLGGGEL